MGILFGHVLKIKRLGHNAFDNTPWIIKLVDFVKQVLAQDRVRIIGVCFGHQILGRALGAHVGRGDLGWEVSVLPMTLTDKGKEIFQREELVRFKEFPFHWDQQS